MTEQQYRIIADRDAAFNEWRRTNGPNFEHETFNAGWEARDRIERPVPNPDEHCTGGDDCAAATHVHGCFADDGTCSTPDEHKPSPHPPTREQIAPLPADARMDAYYYGFDRTGVGFIDAILSAVAIAGKGAHHTESWGAPWEGTTDYFRGHPGLPNAEYAVDLIQKAAQQAADAVLALIQNGADR